VEAEKIGGTVSVIIPARNEALRIGRTVAAVAEQRRNGQDLEVLVVDDGSTDATAARAREAGATVIAGVRAEGNPAAARNRAAREAAGEILIFLDADCLPSPGWLSAHCAAQRQGHAIVGGSLALPSGLTWTARCDYYASSYHVHPTRRRGPVPNHPPANLSVRRDVFEATAGFTESFPVADGHEELKWQGEAASRGISIYFEPQARVDHYNRPGLGNLLRRNYRWGYSALEAKYQSGVSRVAGWYRFPLLMLLAAYPLALVETGYITGSWIMAGQWVAIVFLPCVLLARLAYASAFVVGGWHWLRRGTAAPRRPRWR
jgi:glycosyltransferase involved in cell wall biosynthesis